MASLIVKKVLTPQEVCRALRGFLLWNVLNSTSLTLTYLHRQFNNHLKVRMTVFVEEAGFPADTESDNYDGNADFHMITHNVFHYNCIADEAVVGTGEIRERFPS